MTRCLPVNDRREKVWHDGLHRGPPGCSRSYEREVCQLQQAMLNRLIQSEMTVPEAGIKARDKELLHPIVTVGCNHLSLPLIPPSVRTQPHVSAPRNALFVGEMWLFYNAETPGVFMRQTTELLFSKRSDVLPQDFTKTRTREIRFETFSIALKLDRLPCQDACQISERYDHFNIHSRFGGKTS